MESQRGHPFNVLRIKIAAETQFVVTTKTSTDNTEEFQLVEVMADHTSFEVGGKAADGIEVF